MSLSPQTISGRCSSLQHLPRWGGFTPGGPTTVPLGAQVAASVAGRLAGSGISAEVHGALAL